MRDPRRSEIDDARPDRTDPPAADAAEVVEAPADGDAVVARSSDPAQSPTVIEQESASPAADTPADESAGTPDDLADDLFFDPLLSDEPIDLAAVRADDALIDALGGTDLDAARELIDPDDPLIAMLAAWAAAARPEEPEPTPQRPVLALVPEQGADVPTEPAADDADAPDDDAATAGPPPVDLDAPTLRLATPPADAEPDPEPELAPAAAHPAAEHPAAEHPATGAAEAAPPVLPLVAATDDTPAGDVEEADDAVEPEPAGTDRRRAPLALLTRRVRRRGTPGRRPQAPDPFRRAAAVVVLAALGVSVAAAAGGTAEPGDPGFAITRVFFAERARSLEAAEVVEEGLERAREHLRRRQPALAAQELAAVDTALPDVSDEDGHNRLVDQQQVLATAVALTPPDPRGPDRVETPTTPDRPDRDTSVLAEAAPPDSTTSGSTTTTDGTAGGADVVTSPSKGAQSTTGTAGDPATTGSGTSGAGADGSGTGGAAPVITSTVGGTTDTASVTAEPTTTEPTTSAKPTRPARPTTTRTSDPDEPAGTTSRTRPPRTTTPDDDPDTSTARDTPDDPKDTATVATGSVKVQPAAHHVWSTRPEAHRPGPVPGHPELGSADPVDERVSRAR